jgi:hypothetical protein
VSYASSPLSCAEAMTVRQTIMRSAGKHDSRASDHSPYGAEPLAEPYGRHPVRPRASGNHGCRSRAASALDPSHRPFYPRFPCRISR